MNARTVTDAIDGYYLAWSTKDQALWESLWDEQGEFHDPAGSTSVFVGRDALSARFAAVSELVAEMGYRRRDMWVCGNEVAVLVRCDQRLVGKEDYRYVYELVHTFEVTSSGMLRRVKAYFDSDHQQIVDVRDDSEIG